jgi:hypothetical protein
MRRNFMGTVRTALVVGLGYVGGCVDMGMQDVVLEEETMASLDVEISEAHAGNRWHDYNGLYTLLDNHERDFGATRRICNDLNPLFCWKYASSLLDNAEDREPYCAELANDIRDLGYSEETVDGNVNDCLNGIPHFSY